MAYKQTISQDFMTIYSVVIAFFFGAQSTKSNNQELQNDLEYAETKNAELYNQLMELSKENADLTAKLEEAYKNASNPELPDE
jgi:chaperonin cofactor prefoldin